MGMIGHRIDEAIVGTKIDEIKPGIKANDRNNVVDP